MIILFNNSHIFNTEASCQNNHPWHWGENAKELTIIFFILLIRTKNKQYVDPKYAPNNHNLIITKKLIQDYICNSYQNIL
jgi:hypothetical protein